MAEQRSLPMGLPRACAVLAVLVALAAASALPGATPSWHDSPTPRASLPRAGLSSLPLGARGAVSGRLGEDQPAYRVRGRRTLVAVNRAQGLSASFSRAGAVIGKGDARVSLTLADAGYGGSLHKLPRASPRARANRIVYRRGAVSEWYENGPVGFEQGFTVARPLGAARRGPLTLSLDLGGDLLPTLAGDGRELVFRNAGGGAVLRYGGLVVTDARGRRLPARLSLTGAALLIGVDARAARYPVRIDPFIQAAELAASDGAPDDQLGYSIAVSGSTIVAGAPGHEVGGHDGQGAVYVFSASSSGQWHIGTQTARLTASDGAPDDQLGDSVAISGSTIVAGAPGARAPAGQGGQGAVYVFSEPASGRWQDSTQTAELTASDAAAGDELGYSAAVSGATVAAGAPEHAVGGHGGQGAVYVFAAPPSGRWRTATQTAQLTASDGAPSDELGYAVAVSGPTIAATATGHQVGANADQGAAYVFSAPASGAWTSATQTAELTASDGAANDRLGDSVAVSGAVIAAGSALHAVAANAEQGAVYVFSAPAAGPWRTGVQAAELTASDGAPGDDLGYAVSASPSMIAAGAPSHTVTANSGQGAVYEYSVPGSGRWSSATQTAELTASDGASGDNLGYGVATGGATVAAGTPLRTLSGRAQQGSAYVFKAPSGTVAPARHSPVITELRQSHRRWRSGKRGARFTRAGHRSLPVGTTFSFVLNVRARVILSFTQQVGRRRRTVTRGRLSLTAHPGPNRVSFQGALSPSARLRPGRYTLIIAARGPSGRRSTAHRLIFTIV